MTTGVLRSITAAALASLIAWGAASLEAQSALKPLSLDVIYEPGTQVNFSGFPQQTAWLDDDTYLVRRPGSGAAWRKVNAASGASAPLYDVSAMESALAALPGVSREAAASAARGSLEFNDTHTAALATLATDLYYYEFATGRATRLTNKAGDEELATFSPDGRMVAFVREHNLFAVDVARARERALTADGSKG